MSERAVLRPLATDPKSTSERRRGPRSVHQASAATTSDVRAGSGTDAGSVAVGNTVRVTRRQYYRGVHLAAKLIVLSDMERRSRA